MDFFKDKYGSLQVLYRLHDQRSYDKVSVDGNGEEKNKEGLCQVQPHPVRYRTWRPQTPRDRLTPVINYDVHFALFGTTLVVYRSGRNLTMSDYTSGKVTSE